jgi:hypothetical protein
VAAVRHQIPDRLPVDRGAMPPQDIVAMVHAAQDCREY